MKNWILGLVLLLAVLWSTQSGAQSIHDHNRFHGLSPTIQPNLPQGVEGLFIEFRWRNHGNADVDGHVQLPTGFGPYNITQTINFSRGDQPFAGGPQELRVYPSQQGVRFNGGNAFAFQSGDQGGAAPQGIGCVEPSGGSCEYIAITGEVPTARYGVGIHNFNFFNIPNSTADYDIIVYATNGTAYIEGHGSHLATNTVSGTGLTTGQSQLETVNYTFTGNSPHAVGVQEVISTLGYGIQSDQTQAFHRVIAPVSQQPMLQDTMNVGQQIQFPTGSAPSLFKGNTDIEMLAYYRPYMDAGKYSTTQFLDLVSSQRAAIDAAQNYDNLKTTLLDNTQTGLDVAGLVPVIGIPADGVNASISLGRGNKIEAAATAFGMIPFYGDGVQAGRLGLKYGDDIAKPIIPKLLPAYVRKANLTQDGLTHIVKRHWYSSSSENAGKFTQQVGLRELKSIIGETASKGAVRANTNGRAGNIYEYSFGKIIGTNSSGNATSKLRVVLDASGKVITAFPY